MKLVRVPEVSMRGISPAMVGIWRLRFKDCD